MSSSYGYGHSAHVQHHLHQQHPAALATSTSYEAAYSAGVQRGGETLRMLNNTVLVRTHEIIASVAAAGTLFTICSIVLPIIVSSSGRGTSRMSRASRGLLQMAAGYRSSFIKEGEQASGAAAYPPAAALRV